MRRWGEAGRRATGTSGRCSMIGTLCRRRCKPRILPERDPSARQLARTGRSLCNGRPGRTEAGAVMAIFKRADLSHLRCALGAEQGRGHIGSSRPPADGNIVVGIVGVAVNYKYTIKPDRNRYVEAALMRWGVAVMKHPPPQVALAKGACGPFVLRCHATKKFNLGMSVGKALLERGCYGRLYARGPR
eukprot:6150953-Pyramimonas_sp.AAC.2